VVQLNKFDLPAFFDRDYYESRYLMHMEKENFLMAQIWEDFYFTNALAYAWCEVFEEHKKVDSKKAIVLADARRKELEKGYK